MLLSTRGAQDTFITGNPTRSHFLSVHKQHTPFYKTLYPTESESPTTFGSLMSFRIPVDNGDFINRVCLKGVLKHQSLNSVSASEYKSFLTNNLIDYVELFIGEQSIQKITGEYIAVYHQKHAQNISSYENLYAHGSNSVGQEFYESTSAEDNPFFLDLPFYFHNVNQLAIPICALKKQNIRITIKLREVNEAFQPELFEATLNVTYVHVALDERQFTETTPIIQNIQQLQMAEFKIPQGVLTKSVMLNFSNPVSEMFFMAHRVSDRRNFVDIGNIRLKFNNTLVFDRNNKFLCFKQGLDNHISAPSGKSLDGGGKYCSYSFANNPTNGLPMGSVNMSRIIHKALKVDIPAGIGEDVVVRVYAVSHNVLVFSHGLAGLKF